MTPVIADLLALVPGLLLQAWQVLLVLIAPLVLGITRKVRARALRRIGAPVVQPYRDLWKLLHKEALLPEQSSWVYRAAPYVVFATLWAAAALVPTFAARLPSSRPGDLIAVVALLAVARLAMVLAARDVGAGLGGVGRSRRLLMSSLVEPALLLVFITFALGAGVAQFSAVVTHRLQETGLHAALVLALFSFIAVALVENVRTVAGEPATQFRQAVGHEAVAGYSGRHLALIEAAEALRLVLYMSLLICLFVPFGVATGDSTVTALAIGLVVYLVKIVIIAVALPIAGIIVGRMRIFHKPALLGTALVTAAIAVVLRLVSPGL